MRIRRQVATGVLTALLLVTVHSGGAQMRSGMTTSDILAALKPGQWVVVEGSVQQDLSVLCTDVKLLTGDLLDDDWKLTGIIRKVNKENQTVEILRLPIKIHPEADFNDSSGKLKSFADIKYDMYVELEGTYLKDGTFLAKQIDNETEKIVRKPKAKQQIKVRGKVEKIDPTNRTMTIMGITFQLTDRTQGMSAIK